MTNHTLNKTLGLAIATLLLQTQAAVAAPPTQAELNSIKLYANVTIAQDTVSGWGPWTEFEPPAAGNAPLATIPGSSDMYRSLPQVVAGSPSTPSLPPLPPIPNTEYLGFGVFHVMTTDPAAQEDIIDGPHPLIVAGTTITPTSTGSWLPDALELTSIPITGSYPPPTTVTLTLQENGVYSNSPLLTINPDEPVDVEAIETSFYNNPQTRLTLVPYPDEAVDAQTAEASPYDLLSYILPANVRTPLAVTEIGVIGRRTSAADMSNLQGRNVVATYQGYSVSNVGLVPMVINANMGAGTWSGIWNGGADANGSVGYKAGGTITGALFNSTPGSITATDSSNISGRVTGAFFGPMAAAAGGVADITKNNVRHVNTFLAVKVATPVSTPPVPQGNPAR